MAAAACAVILERAIGQAARAARRRPKAPERTPSSESRQIIGERVERGFDRRARGREIVVPPADRERNRAQQIKRHTDHEIGLVRLDPDKAVHEAIERKIVGARRAGAQAPTAAMPEQFPSGGSTSSAAPAAGRERPDKLLMFRPLQRRASRSNTARRYVGTNFWMRRPVIVSAT